MKVDPIFSIILPTFNRENFIKRAIDSVLAQVFTDFELIIIDDGSTDNTDKVVCEYDDPRVKYFYKQNEERNIARNFGITIAKGQYICFLDSDDYLLPNHLEVARILCRDVSSWGYIGNLTWSYEVGNNVDAIRKNLIKENPFAINGVIISRELLTDIRFIESRNLLVSEDHYLWLLLAARYPMQYSSAVTYFVDNHVDRSLRNIDKEKLVEGINLLIENLSKDFYFMDFYKNDAQLYFACKFTFLALIANQNHDWHLALKSLTMALKKDFRVLQTKRFWASLKNLTLGWLKFK
ncbi:MAG TPA: glycosyltransferase family A protein [Fulvivirga sp.]|nr:glycosyltransferase family A protein [Fulvivirga sp.]